MGKLSQICFALGLLLLGSDAVLAANAFVYTPPADMHAGKFSGEMPLDKIGEMKLPRGLASFADDELSIRAVPQWLFDRNLVLKGVIVRAEAVPQQGRYVLGGLVYMTDGIWLKNLSNANASETIDTVDGATVKGLILSRTADAFTVKHKDGSTETLAFSKIRTINSKRAFAFNISADGVKLNPADNSVAFDARQLVLKPSQPQHGMLAFRSPALDKSNLTGTEEGISKTALATFVALDVFSTIVPAIAIPLVINAKNQSAAKRALATTVYNNFVSGLQQNAAAAAPASSAGISSGP